MSGGRASGSVATGADAACVYIILAAHNGAALLASTIDHLLALDYLKLTDVDVAE